MVLNYQPARYQANENLLFKSQLSFTEPILYVGDRPARIGPVLSGIPVYINGQLRVIDIYAAP